MCASIRGAGRFDGDCIAVSRESTTTITPADFNRDGRIDLAVPHREGGQSFIYFNDGKTAFASRVPFGPSSSAIRMSPAADVNSDGRMDVVVIDERSGPAIYLQQPDGMFGDRLPLGNERATAISITPSSFTSPDAPNVRYFGSR